MTLIEETKSWLELHRLAGRELEVLACELRIKTLERCEAKKHKPEFIDKLGYKAEGNIVTFDHMRKRSDNQEHYIDDVLVNYVILKAITDFKESRK